MRSKPYTKKFIVIKKSLYLQPLYAEYFTLKYQNMKKIIVLILIVFSAFSLYSQNNQITQLIYEGIKYHEQGKYKSAISKY